MTVAPEQAAALSEYLLSRKLVGGWQCKPFGAGRFSETFAIDNGNNERYVLRVAPSDSLLQLFYKRRMMRREPAIHQRLRSETNVPVPEITAYDFSRRQIDRDYLIMPRLDGEPLSADGLDSAGQRRALREWGDYVAQIHDLADPHDRYGYAEYCGVTQPAFWEGYGRKVDNRHEAAAVRRFFYLLYEHQKYIVISMSALRKDPRGAQRYATECWNAMESFRDSGQPVF